MCDVSDPWLDKQQLQSWLRVHHGDVMVTECEVEPGSAKGDNYLSHMYRLFVNTKGGKVYRLVVKSQMNTGSLAEFMKESNLFKKEMHLYSTTMPRMTALLKEMSQGDFAPISPMCYIATKNFLVFEDLNHAGFKMLDRCKGLDLQHCLLVMRTLAKFHAASAVLYEQDQSCMKPYEVSFYTEYANNTKWENFFSSMTRNLAEELDTWPDQWKPYSTKLKKLADRLFSVVNQVTMRSECGFSVLTHGDLWTNNMMFSGQSDKIRFFDYQLAHFTSPAIDLHYFITTSATYEVKMNYADQLIKEYHTTLCDTLVGLGYTRTPISLEELRAELDRKIFYGLYSIISPYAVMQCGLDCEFNIDSMLETGATPGLKIYGDTYKKTVEEMFPFYEKKGAFNY